MFNGPRNATLSQGEWSVVNGPIYDLQVTGGTGTCHTSDFPFDICVKSIFQDITFSVFAYDINKKGVSLQAKYGKQE
jgi:hypothetical protein